MTQQSTEATGVSSVGWEDLEAFVRQRIQGFVQELLEEEVGAPPGRGRYERRAAVDAAPGYRNGYGPPRQLGLTSGTITARRPEVPAKRRRPRRETP